MAQREIRSFDYVNQPYEPVRDALRADAAAIFKRATQVAEDRSGDLVASLSVDFKGIQLSKSIAIRLGGMREESLPGTLLSHVTRVELEWQAASSPGLFPVMKAELAIYPLSPTETQVELTGRYEPPMGVLGVAIDAVVGHRIAEATCHRFVRAVVERLRNDLPQPG